jgi:hypothetical protein
MAGDSSVNKSPFEARLPFSCRNWKTASVILELAFQKMAPRYSRQFWAIKQTEGLSSFQYGDFKTIILNFYLSLHCFWLW